MKKLSHVTDKGKSTNEIQAVGHLIPIIGATKNTDTAHKNVKK